MNDKFQKQQTLKDYFTTAFNVHESLWTAYDNKPVQFRLDYCNAEYDVYYKEDFCCAVLPNYFNDKENNFWMTNNMARSTHGTYQIQAAPSHGEIHRTTWIIGRIAANEHYLKGHISTTHDLSGVLKYANIHSFYYGSQIELYRYVNRYNGINFIDSSFVNRDIKMDYLIF